MIVAQFISDNEKLVAFVWLDAKRFHASLYSRSNLTGPAIEYCKHAHLQQEPAENCAVKMMRRREKKHRA